jgi:thymidylate synthase ThyX
MTITAKIVADSISPENIRLTTIQLRYPRFIHSEFMTHRVFSRNASSSRAIPVERLIKDVMEDPYIPIYWGANQKGMQANQECNELVSTWQVNDDQMRLEESNLTREKAWSVACMNAIHSAKRFSRAGYHKQIINRLLEPFCHINVVVTATDWANFFALRCHKDAQPEMRALAEAMRDAMVGSTPQLLRPGEWHLPYVGMKEYNELYSDERRDEIEKIIRLSVARCARVSYLTQEGKTPNIAEDLALYDRLVGTVPLHASPCEHQATPDKMKNGGYCNHKLCGNFRGWIQFRKTLPNECAHD